MGFRVQKRINIGKGFGLNISKSGISSSYRNKRGSFGNRGYSIRTGIPGLIYRKSFPKSSKGGCVVVFLTLTTLSIIIGSQII